MPLSKSERDAIWDQARRDHQAHPDHIHCPYPPKSEEAKEYMLAAAHFIRGRDDGVVS